MITPLRSLVDTLGYTYLTMKIYLLALPINACLNYAFIFGKCGLPRLGGIRSRCCVRSNLLATVRYICFYRSALRAFSSISCIGLGKT